MAATPTIDEQKLEQFMGQFVQDMGAAATAPLVVIGDKLGLYKAMAGGDPLTPAELAGRTGCRERYLREWLCQQAASGYVEYDAESGTFRLPPEQELALAHDDSPAFIPGAFQLIAAIVKDEPHITERFRSGEGFGWHEHDHDLFEGTERFFRPGYLANLVESWLPSLDGVVEKLEAGARVADVGCGHGASTILMAQAYPRSTFVGTDYHEGSIEAARRAAERAGVADRITFEVVGGQGAERRPVRPRVRVRRAARHGRPRRRRAPRALAARRRRHLARGRADGRRCDRGQPQPGRARVLRGLDDALHARLAEPGGRARARRPGRRAAPHRGAARGRPQPRAAVGRDAVQPRARGQAVAMVDSVGDRRGQRGE